MGTSKDSRDNAYEALSERGENVWPSKNLMHSQTVIKKKKKLGSLGGAAVWRLPLAQGAILETRDRIPRQAPGAWSLLLPLPMSLPLSLSHCVPIINK